MDRDQPGERAAAIHLRILSERAENALEQARAARAMAERASRLLRRDDGSPLIGTER